MVHTSVVVKKIIHAYYRNSRQQDHMATTTTCPYGGRVQCILLSTVEGYVVYERFYDQFNDIQKAEIRTSFDDALGSNAMRSGLELTGRFKNGRVVGLCMDDMIVFALGTGTCDEMILLELLEHLIAVLKDVVKGHVLNDLVLFEQYMDVVHVVDAMCKDVRSSSSSSLHCIIHRVMS